MRKTKWQRLLDLAHEIASQTSEARQDIDVDERMSLVLETNELALELTVRLSEIVKQKGKIVN